MQWWHDLWWSNPCYCLFWFCLCLMSLFCKLQAIAQCLYLSLIAAMAPLPAMDDFAHIEAEFQLFLACFHPQSFVFVFPDCGLQLRFSNFLEHPQNICNALTAGRHSPYHIITLEPGQTLHFSNWLKTWQKVALRRREKLHSKTRDIFNEMHLPGPCLHLSALLRWKSWKQHS